jgi:hypothetical protein
MKTGKGGSFSKFLYKLLWDVVIKQKSVAGNRQPIQ